MKVGREVVVGITEKSALNIQLYAVKLEDQRWRFDNVHGANVLSHPHRCPLGNMEPDPSAVRSATVKAINCQPMVFDRPQVFGRDSLNT